MVTFPSLRGLLPLPLRRATKALGSLWGKLGKESVVGPGNQLAVVRRQSLDLHLARYAGTHTLVNRNGGLLNGIRFGLVCLYCSEERCFVGRIECVVTHKMPAIAVRSAGFFPTAPSDNEGRH